MIRLTASSLLIALPVAFAALAYAPSARADVLPNPGDCLMVDAGVACNTAGPNNNLDGVCVCSGGDDGGNCVGLQCEVVDAGSPNTCVAAGGTCIAVTPAESCKGHISQDKMASCPGVGDDCCLPGEAQTDAGKPKDGGEPTTKDGGKPTTKDAGHGSTGQGSGTGGPSELGSSGGCTMTSSGSSGDAAWFVGLGVVGLALAGSRRRRS